MKTDSWGLHPDCIEDCCWASRLERAGGPTEVTTEAVQQAAALGLVERGDDEHLELNFDRLERIGNLNLSRFREACAELAAWGRLKVKERLMADESRRAVWSLLAPVAVSAWDAGLRTESEFTTWIGEDVIPLTFRTRLMRELLRLGVYPQEVWESLSGGDSEGDWRRMHAAEFRRIVRSEGLSWPEDPGLARRRALAVAS